MFQIGAVPLFFLSYLPALAMPGPSNPVEPPILYMDPDRMSLGLIQFRPGPSRSRQAALYATHRGGRNRLVTWC